MPRILMLASFGLEIVECGGTLARHRQAGDEVFAAVTLSTPAYRPQITKAAQVLGIPEVAYLDFPTGAWELDLAAKEKIVTLIRRVRPDIVICQDPHHAQHDLDPDRRLLALLYTEALALAGRDYWRKDECGGYAGHLVSAIYYMTPEQPNCVVEISETFALKQRALAELDYQHAFSAETIEQRVPVETLRQVISDYDVLKTDKSALGLALQHEFDKAHALVHGLAGHAKATLAEAYRREGVCVLERLLSM